MTSNTLVKLEVEIKLAIGNYAPAESVAREKIQQQLLYGYLEYCHWLKIHLCHNLLHITRYMSPLFYLALADVNKLNII